MTIRSAIGVLLAIGIGVIAWGYWSATSDPIIRTASVRMPDWPEGQAPIRALLISDIHVAGPDMPPSRVSHLVRQLNALEPDIVLIAGDLISEKYPATTVYRAEDVIRPLRGLRAPLGVVVVMGNHDYWADEDGFRRGIVEAGLTLLENAAVKRGPLVIGGVGDRVTGHADVPATFRAMSALTGPHIVLTHDPDVVPNFPERVTAVFAGHTHCGQATKPWSGAPVHNVSRYGMRFQCGDITDNGQRIFVTAGLGTSAIWLRYGAPPDAWLVTLGP